MITSVWIDGELLKEAKDLGLDLSKVAENALREAVSRLKGSDSSAGSFSGRAFCFAKRV